MRALITSVCVALFVFSAAHHAIAASPGVWPLAHGAPVILGYGAPWTDDGRACTHRGVDLGAQPGDTVAAPLSASVAWTGQVPAGEGARCGAVTLQLPDGTKMTLMPLDGIRVRTGDAVKVGDEVGVLAAAGDNSSAAAHLHVSLRRGSAYLDPSSLLIAPAAADAAPKAPQPAPKAKVAPQRSVRGTVAPAAVAGSAPALAPATAPRPAPSGITVVRPDAADAPLSTAAASSKVASVRTAPTSGVRSPQAATSGITRVRPEAQARTAANAAWQSLAARLVRAVSSATRWGALLVLAMLAGLGLLWPLWRRERDGESGDVRAGGDAVAAAVSR